MNPWQEIPLADYEAHMQSEAVGQAAALSELFGEVLAQFKPASVAVLGIAGGNGLEHIDAERTRRVVGVDLNPEYLAAVRERFGKMTGLELYEVDLAEEPLAVAPVELVHVALVLEHAGLGRCLENALGLVAPRGTLSVVLQLPAAESPNVGNSGVASMGKLRSLFKLVDPAALTRTLTERGLRLIREEKRQLPAGKQFWLGVFAQG